jgi:S-adenosylmethionine:tRNA ribosyltransferase-isomerase
LLRVDISDIDYELPERLIAQTPCEPRDSARLLVNAPSGMNHLHVSDIDSLFDDGDVMVVNHTRVLPARLKLRRQTGGAVEVLLLEEREEQLFQWEALVKPGGKLSARELLVDDSGNAVLHVVQRSEAGDTFYVEFVATEHTAMMDRIIELGEIPLPPYITTHLEDANRYQTVFAHDQKSSAAPTAGLHFTVELLERIRSRGVRIYEVELVVGLDTFKPISVDNPLDHQIHTESYRVPFETLAACREARANGNRVIAIGTTATRALESAVTFNSLSGRTNLFITPGYQWKIVDLMLTNFHMPRTTLLLMIEAFIGKQWRDVYSEAIAREYRMLSFGDAMLLYRDSNVSR